MSYICNLQTLIEKAMRNTFIGLTFLSILWLSSCGSSATPEKKPDSTIPAVSTGTEMGSETGSNAATTASTEGEGSVIQLNKAMFLEKVYDFEKNPKQWTYKGDKPCIIDFYADWCKPCKMVAPIMAELSEKYKGQIVIYKINTDQERELAQFFGIRSIPTIFFCPAKGDPQMAQGAMPKESYEQAINEVLLQKK